MAPVECFICLDDAAADLLTDVCACTQGAVHTRCLVRWIRESRQTSCAVCGQEYAGVAVRECRVPLAGRAALACAWAALFSAYPTYLLVLLFQEQLPRCAACAAAALVALLYEAAVVWLVCRGVWAIPLRARTVDVRELEDRALRV